MLPGESEAIGSVTGRMYFGLPDGHRTTFVVGMSDMLGFARLYVAPEHRPRIESMLQYLVGRDNELVRKQFDTYMRAREERLGFGAATCYFTALNEWCGFETTPNAPSPRNWFSRLRLPK